MSIILCWLLMMLPSSDFFSIIQCTLKEEKNSPCPTTSRSQKNIKNTYTDEHSNPIENVQKLLCKV